MTELKFESLSDKAITAELTRIEPEGFCWGVITHAEFIKFRAVARKAESEILRQVVTHLNTLLKHNPIKGIGLRSELGKFVQELKKESEG